MHGCREEYLQNYKIEFGTLPSVTHLNCIHSWSHSKRFVIEIELVILYDRVDFFPHSALVRNSPLRMEMLYLVRSLMVSGTTPSSFCVAGNNEINE